MRQIIKATMVMGVLLYSVGVEAKGTATSKANKIVQHLKNQIERGRHPNLVAILWDIINSELTVAQQAKIIHRINDLIVFHPLSEQDGEVFDNAQRVLFDHVKILYNNRQKGRSSSYALKTIHSKGNTSGKSYSIRDELENMAKKLWES